MIARVELATAFVLHCRPYRDTSLIVDFFSLNHGRISAVVRGVRTRKSKIRALINPFTRLLISFQGSGDLKFITALEADNQVYRLEAQALFAGCYLNELLVRTLSQADPHDEVFHAYQASIAMLKDGAPLEPVLRSFELVLLSELGYGVDFLVDSNLGDSIDKNSYYCFYAEQGFQRIHVESELLPTHIIRGEVILALAARDFSCPETLRFAKQLCRRLLKPLLGSRPLASRDLFFSSISD